MAEKDSQTRSRWLWWLAGGATLIVVLAAAGAAWYYHAGRKVWTDGAEIRVSHDRASIREVIWTSLRPLGDAVNTDRQEYEPALTPDEETLYFVRGLPGEGADIYVTRRAGEAWSQPVPLAAVNSEHDELGPRVSPDGKFLLFYSDRPGGLGQYDIWAARRSEDGWSAPFNLGEGVNSKYNDYSPAFTPDGRRLIFATNRRGAAEVEGETPWRATIRQGRLGDYDLFIAERSEADAAPTAGSQPAPGPGERPRPPLSFAGARPLEGVNTPFHEGACCVSPAGDFLYFASSRPGGYGGFDLYRCRIRDDRCGEVVNLGCELNTPANEMDPQMGMGGFVIYFSSDRPEARGYDLFTAESREVYAARDRIAPPQLAWGIWALLIAVALLIPLLLLLRAAGYRHLSLLQKCIAVSLLAHIGITMLMSLFFIYRPILHHVAEAAGLTTAVNLELGEEVRMRMQIRQQITDIPVTDLPVSDPTLAELARPRPTAIAPVAPETPDLNVPHARITPAPMTVQPEAPRLIQPTPAPQRISLPAPPLRSEAPTIRLSVEAPLVEAERRPEAAAQAPTPVKRQATRTHTPSVAATEVQLAAVPVRPQTDSIAEVPAAERATPPEAEQIAPAATPTIRAELDVVTPQLSADRVAAAPATAPAVRAIEAVSAQVPTGSPRGEASLEALAVPAATEVGDSLAVAAAVSRPPEPTPAAVAVDIAAATDAPEIRLPVLAAPAAAGAEPAPVATSIRAPGDLQARPLVGVTPSAAPQAVTALASAVPARMTPASMIRPEVAIVDRARTAEPTAQRFAPAARVTPLIPLAGPGKLTSPDTFFQRSFEQRQKFIDAMGGSEESEQAVARALAYLARTQLADGHWPFRPGSRDSGRRGKNDMAITGLAALCFLSGNHTPTKPGPYQQCIRKGIDYMVARQKPDGDLRFGGDMYSQAIAAIAIAEAAAMTNDPSYRVAAIRGGRFIVNCQNRKTGGWRYQPHDPGDTSVFGWEVLALRSVGRVGMRIPSETRKLCFRWLDSVSRSRHKMLAGYQGPSHTLPMTAEAVTSRIFLGQRLKPEEIREACDYVKFGARPKKRCYYYYWYYGSLALAQMQNEAWRKWNDEMQKKLIRMQQRDGSWDEGYSSNYGRRGGRIYATALSALTLQVYYRYLPMYQPGQADGGR